MLWQSTVQDGATKLLAQLLTKDVLKTHFSEGKVVSHDHTSLDTRDIYKLLLVVITRKRCMI